MKGELARGKRNVRGLRFRREESAPLRAADRRSGHEKKDGFYKIPALVEAGLGGFSELSIFYRLNHS